MTTTLAFTTLASTSNPSNPSKPAVKVSKLNPAKVPGLRIWSWYYQSGPAGSGWYGPYPTEEKALAASQRGEGTLWAVQTDAEVRQERQYQRAQAQALLGTVTAQGGSVPVLNPDGEIRALAVVNKQAIQDRLAHRPKSHPKLATPRARAQQLGALMVRMGSEIMDATLSGSSDTVKRRVTRLLQCFDAGSSEDLRALAAGILGQLDSTPEVEAEETVEADSTEVETVTGTESTDELVRELMMYAQQ
jgi:hypothetical protein